MSASLDHYTPCAPRPTEQRARRKGDNTGLGSHKDMLQRLSASISLQEDRFRILAHSLDINAELHDYLDFTGDVSETSDECGCNPSAQRSSHNLEQISPMLESHPRPRPGRLSPTILRMILSPNNISFFSESSSAADTSYDSGLYRWLGVKESSILESSPRPLRSSKHASDTNDSHPDASTVTSRSAYSQHSPLSSPSSRIVLPLSPPATVRPPFTEFLHRNEVTAVETVNSRDTNAMTHPGFQFSRDLIGEKDYSVALHEFAAPLLLKNHSLIHYVPSATILRHFQRVITELRRKYIPNDQGNNVPNWTKRRPTNRETMVQRSYDLSSPRSPLSPLFPLYKPSQTADPTASKTNTSPLRPAEIESGTTIELYAEMASILFEQVAQDETLADKLRQFADRLETLAQKKRTTALVIDLRGRENVDKEA